MEEASCCFDASPGPGSPRRLRRGRRGGLDCRRQSMITPPSTRRGDDCLPRSARCWGSCGTVGRLGGRGGAARARRVRSNSSRSRSCSWWWGSSTRGRARSSTRCWGRRRSRRGSPRPPRGSALLRHGERWSAGRAARRRARSRRRRRSCATSDRGHAGHERGPARARGAHARTTCPRADLVLFVTSADRPFTESERAFLEAIREWGKKVVVVLNKADLLETKEDVDAGGRVRPRAGAADARLRTRGLPGLGPGALRAAAGRRGRARRERLPGLRGLGSPREALDDAERFRLKLAEPARGRPPRHREAAAVVVAGRLDRLEEDVATLESVEAQLAARAADLDPGLPLPARRRGEGAPRLRAARATLLRGAAPPTPRFRELLHRERLRERLRATWWPTLPRDVEKRVEAIVDWMVEAELRQWQDVMALLTGAGRAPGRMVGPRWTTASRYDRQRLLDAVGARRSAPSRGTTAAGGAAAGRAGP